MCDHVRSTTTSATLTGFPSFGFPLVFNNNLEGETYGAEVSANFQALDWWRLHRRLYAAQGGTSAGEARADGFQQRAQRNRRSRAAILDALLDGSAPKRGVRHRAPAGWATLAQQQRSQRRAPCRAYYELGMPASAGMSPRGSRALRGRAESPPRSPSRIRFPRRHPRRNRTQRLRKDRMAVI